MIVVECKQPCKIRWHNVAKQWHRLNGPAIQTWYDNGQKWYVEYFENGKRHRDSNVGPAYQRWYDNGQKWRVEYWENEKRHRNSNVGPAIQTWHNNGQKPRVEYWENGHSVLSRAE